MGSEDTHRSTTLSGPERERKQEHGGKAEDREKMLTTVAPQDLHDMVKAKMLEVQF
jgi:hypothetical protein